MFATDLHTVCIAKAELRRGRSTGHNSAFTGPYQQGKLFDALIQGTIQKVSFIFKFAVIDIIGNIFIHCGNYQKIAQAVRSPNGFLQPPIRHKTVCKILEVQYNLFRQGLCVTGYKKVDPGCGDVTIVEPGIDQSSETVCCIASIEQCQAIFLL